MKMTTNTTHRRGGEYHAGGGMMNDKPSNPPAFPITIEQYGDPTSSGITMRDYFAAAALQGLLCNSQAIEFHNILKHAPTEAYQLADAMLKTRES